MSIFVISLVAVAIAIGCFILSQTVSILGKVSRVTVTPDVAVELLLGLIKTDSEITPDFVRSYLHGDRVVVILTDLPQSVQDAVEKNIEVVILDGGKVIGALGITQYEWVIDRMPENGVKASCEELGLIVEGETINEVNLEIEQAMDDAAPDADWATKMR